MAPLSRPRAPDASFGSALYESHYLTACDPEGGRAVWLRYTAIKRIGEPAHATIWLTYFDRSAVDSRALRVTAHQPLRDPGDGWSSSSLGEFGPEGACGAMSADTSASLIREANWELSWEARAAELPYLPARWLYDRAVPRSNGAALMPSGRTTGVLTIDGETTSLDGWEAMIGHNWGSEHAHQWCWIHIGGVGDDRCGWVDLVLARIKLGPLLTPWIASGALHLGDRRYAPAPLRRVVCDRAGELTEITLPLSHRTIADLAITAPHQATVQWDYASPTGPGRRVENCSVADATLCLRTPTNSRSLTFAATVAVEHGAPAISL